MDAPFTYYVKCKIYDTLMDLTDRSACTEHRASSAKRAHRADAYETNMVCTDKSFSEALILASTNPKYDKRLFIELRVQYMKITSWEHVVSLNCSECQNQTKTQFMYLVESFNRIDSFLPAKNINKRNQQIFL